MKNIFKVLIVIGISVIGEIGMLIDYLIDKRR